MDFRGKHVKVSDFTLEELQMVEKALVDLGVGVFEEVNEDHMNGFCEGYYGVAHDNDLLFLNYSESFKGMVNSAVLMSKREMFDELLIDVGNVEEEKYSEECGVSTLYRVVAHSGITYLFDNTESISMALKTTTDSKLHYCQFAFGTDGKVLKNRSGITALQMLTGNYTIRDI